MGWIENKRRYRHGAPVGWEAARLEFEHQAAHWDTPDHGETGHLIATAIRAAIDIAQTGGLHCQHRAGTGSATGVDAGSVQREATTTHAASTRRDRDAA